jgi:hypothetical protein
MGVAGSGIAFHDRASSRFKGVGERRELYATTS